MKKPLLITLGIILIIIGGWRLTQQTTTVDTAVVEAYVRAHISELSPMPEVLGGTFYLTSITFTDTSSGVVDYEDGHVAYIADFTFSFDTSGNVVIDSFQVRGE